MKANKVILFVLIIIFAIGLSYGVYLFSGRNLKKDRTVCAQDALLCANGLYVGRKEPNCVFAPCSGGSFTGTLRRNNGGESFALILPSPNNEGEVNYTMPLKIKDNNLAAPLAGKKIKIYGNFTEGTIFEINRMEELPGDAGDPTLGDAGVGRSVYINGVLVTLNKVVQDSRCPIGVQCIQAGWVTVNVTLKSNTDKETIDISSNKGPHAFDSYQVSIENVKPSHTAGTRLKQEDYFITFRIRSN